MKNMNEKILTPEEICLEKNRVMFGKYFCMRGVPQIELIVPKTKYDEDGEEVAPTMTKLVYLSAFRRYCFQVSMTRDGDCCLGSTPVFGLETFCSIEQRGNSNLSQDSTVRYIISTVAMDAIRDYCNHNYAVSGLIMPREFFRGALSNPEWEKFIDATLRFCRHEVIEDTMSEEDR